MVLTSLAAQPGGMGTDSSARWPGLKSLPFASSKNLRPYLLSRCWNLSPRGKQGNRVIKGPTLPGSVKTK